MEPYSLHLAGILLTFILKVTAGFVLSLALACLLPNPRHRFLIWLGFLLGAGLAWVDLLAGEMVSILSAAWRGAILVGATTSEAREHLTVPASWGVWIARLTLFLAAIYVAVAVTLLARQVYKHLRLRAWLKEGQQPSPELRLVFQRLCREFNIRRCRLLVLPRMESPVTVYWWTPRVILPEVCEGLVGTSQLENVLRHELIHTLRCDYLWATFADLLCALLFFHPARWHARRRLIMQRELACDLAVVEAQPERRADYADSLARFVRLTLQQRPAFGVDFATPSSFLGTRIRCILTEPEEVPGWKRAVADVVFVAFLVIFGSVSPALSVSFAVRPEASKLQVQHPSVITSSSAAQHDRLNQLQVRKSISRAPGSHSAQSQSVRTPGRDRAEYPESLPNQHTDHSAGTAVPSGVQDVAATPHSGGQNHEHLKQ